MLLDLEKEAASPLLNPISRRGPNTLVQSRHNSFKENYYISENDL